ncbi:NAD(P)H-binding protein [Arthrobacter sp. 2MCAF14]|uniref:NAD(P)H-binding protein n=1 Tax=Arthrobacter sp. 2MCAF14 TaxID=3232982 RepID=UPI003F8DD9F3
MNHGPSTVLIVGATGSIGRHAVAEALRQGYAVRALVRDPARAARLPPNGADLVIGDLTRPETLGPALDGVDAPSWFDYNQPGQRTIFMLQGDSPAHPPTASSPGTRSPVSSFSWRSAAA